jgi:hypothetical protein
LTERIICYSPVEISPRHLSDSIIQLKSGWQKSRGYLVPLWSQEGITLPNARVAQEMWCSLSCQSPAATNQRSRSEKVQGQVPLLGKAAPFNRQMPTVSHDSVHATGVGDRVHCRMASQRPTPTEIKRHLRCLTLAGVSHRSVRARNAAETLKAPGHRDSTASSDKVVQ